MSIGEPSLMMMKLGYLESVFILDRKGERIDLRDFDQLHAPSRTAPLDLILEEECTHRIRT